MFFNCFFLPCEVWFACILFFLFYLRVFGFRGVFVWLVGFVLGWGFGLGCFW